MQRENRGVNAIKYKVYYHLTAEQPIPTSVQTIIKSFGAIGFISI